MKAIAACALCCACLSKPTLERPECEPVAFDELNTSANERGPWLSSDGTRLMYSSDQRVFEAARDTADTTFSAPVDHPILVPGANAAPFLSNDLRELWFTAMTQELDIEYTTRASDTGEFATSGDGFETFHSGDHESDVAFTADMLTAIVTYRERDMVDAELFAASRARPSDPFAIPQPIVELANPSGVDCCAAVSPDGLTLLWDSDRNGQRAIWRATRREQTTPWEIDAPILVDGFANTDPHINASGDTLVFASSRMGSFDLFHMPWQCFE